MVLYYGLFALETANNTVAAKTSASQRGSVFKRSRASQKMASSSNSWIYTEDLKKRFEERYGDYRYIFVPIYIDGKTARYYYNSTAMIPQKSTGEHSWIYSRSLRDHFSNSTSKISSSVCSVTNQGFMRDEIPRKKKLFQRSSSKDKSRTSLSSTKYQTNDIVEEEDDESVQNENHSIPLIKHSSGISSHLATESTNDNSTIIQTMMNNESSTAKHAIANSNRLTRLRSFFFKTSSTLSNTQS